MIKLHLYYVYILTNVHKNVLYTGVTNDLERRCFEHRNKLIKGFTQKYNVDKLVYFEQFEQVDFAIDREKKIKGYSRAKKKELIGRFNPEWIDLFAEGRIIIPEKP